MCVREGEREREKSCTNDARDVLDNRLPLLSGSGGGVFLEDIDVLDPDLFRFGAAAGVACKKKVDQISINFATGGKMPF